MSEDFSIIYTRVDGMVLKWNKATHTWEFLSNQTVPSPSNFNDPDWEAKDLQAKWDQLTQIVQLDLIDETWATGGPGHDVFIIAARMRDLGYVHPIVDGAEDADQWVKA